MKKLTLLLFSFFIITNVSLSQSFSPEEKEILLLQDSRTLGENDKLLSYLNSDNKDVVSRALFALANIQDSSTADEIGTVMLSNPNEYIRYMAAYAIGQIPCEPSQIYLRTALKSEKNMFVRQQLMEAIGKVGAAEDLELVPTDVSNIDYDKFYSALSILRFGLRKIKNERSFQILADILNSNPDANTTMLCLYTLWRTGDDKLLKPHTDLIKKYLKDTNGLNRSYAIAALGKLKDLQIFLEVLDNVKNESDWRAKVNALNMMSNFTFEQIKGEQKKINSVLVSLLDRKEDENNKISYLTAYLAAVNRLYSNQKLTIKDNKELYDFLYSFTVEVTHSKNAIAGEVFKTLGNIFQDEMKDVLIERFQKTEDFDLKADIIRAFSSFNDGKIFRDVRSLLVIQVQIYGETHTIDKEKYIGAEDLAKIYRAYTELINACLPKVDLEDKNTIRLMCYDFFTSKDVTMIANSMETLKDSTLQLAPWKSETEQVLQFEFPNLKLPQDFDLVNLYTDFIGEMKITGLNANLEANLSSDQYEITKRSADALKKITGNDYSDRIKNKIYNKDFDWDYLKRIFDNKYASVKTNKGLIKIELFPEVTPFTVYNFVKLSEKGYYNGTMFHRVVPNFVIQGGDPTATGNGGPGYSIRSEFSQLNYFTGAVGMASSGKDTEGSQWFITHSPQLHLDSRYTLFGIVVGGQDVVDKTQIGDKIESITFSNTK